MNIPEFNLNGFIKFPTKSQKKFKSFKWKVKGGEYVSEGGGPNIPDNIDCLCFTSTGESTVALANYGNNAPVLYYSKDKKKWSTWDYATITLADSESVYLCGENPNGFSKSGGEMPVYSRFIMTGSIAASGNIQTLLSLTEGRMDVTPYCYYYMFSGCSALTEAPTLSAITLAKYCYCSMFADCVSLKTAPALPAKTLAYGCYGSMFAGCTFLTEAPELPATTLAENCYGSMFRDCTSLTTAPVLPAKTLANYCYQSMFNSCTALQSVTIHVTSWSTLHANNWLLHAGKKATNPTVYCPANLSIPQGNYSGIPTGWTRADLPTS